MGTMQEGGDASAPWHNRPEVKNSAVSKHGIFSWVVRRTICGTALIGGLAGAKGPHASPDFNLLSAWAEAHPTH